MDFLERYRDIVPDWEAFRAIQSQPLCSSARINTLKTKRDVLLERLAEDGVPFQSFSWYPLGLKLDVKSPGKLLESLLGHIHIQEELSMVPPLVLDPQPGESILDLCASPGSKTTQISAMMDNRGLVIANEPSLARVAALRSNCERLGAMNVAITRYDGRRFPRGCFDRTLVDAPCSAEGRERRGPGVLERSSCKRSRDLQVLQIGLLKNALHLTRSGGVVVYSTCTYAPEENEMVLRAVLDELGEAKDADGTAGAGGRCQARLERITIPGLQECPGIVEWNGSWLGEEMRSAARYYPHLNDTGGFFVAKIVKN
jgi:NOL1/NOP2/sun family putative RNA methylase